MLMLKWGFRRLCEGYPIFVNKFALLIKTAFLFVRDYKRLWPYLKPSLGLFLLSMLCAMFVGVLDAMMPLAIKLFLDSLFDSKSIWQVIESLPLWVKPFLQVLDPYKAELSRINLMENAAYIPFGIILFTLAQGVFNYTATVASTVVRVEINQRLKHQLFGTLMRYETAWYDQASTGEVLTYFSADVDAATLGITDIIKTSTIRTFSIIGLALTLIGLSPQLAIIALGVLGTIVIPITLSRRYLKRISEQYLLANSTLSTHYTEALQGNRVIKLLNLNEHQSNLLFDALKLVRKTAIRMAQISGLLTPMMHSIAGLGIGLVLYYGSTLIQNNVLSVGGFAAFITSLILLYTPIKSLGNSSTAFHMAFLALERVFTWLDRTPHLKAIGQVQKRGLDSGIEIQHLRFQYREELPTVLKDVSLRVPKGSSVALVGGSGSGKSTLAHLLLRLYDANQGSITFDGIPIHEIEEASFRQLISAVFQDNFIFCGSIRENLLIAKQDATDEELKQALTHAYLWETIQHQMPQGLETIVGERGVMLSGGQRQRLAIARAFLRNAPILVLDEATSALDNESERVIQRAIEELMQHRTVIIIAHRLSTIQHCDNIIVMQHGEIVEQGTHPELLNKGGTYANLHNLNEFS
jgi:ATP-binding cassette, subfamily B, bacterial MsbA